MRRFFIFLFLVAIQFDHPVLGENLEFNSKVGDKLEVLIEIPNINDVKIIKSRAIFNGPMGDQDNIIYPTEDTTRFNYVTHYGTTFRFRFKNLTAQDFGKWTIVTDYKKLSEEEIKQQRNIISIFQIESANILPTSQVYALDGQYVNLSLEPGTFDNAECQLINDEGKIYKKYLLSESNSTEDDSEEIQRYKNGLCGFRIHVKVGMSGGWKIAEESKKEYKKRIGGFDLDIDTYRSIQKDHEKWYKRSSQTIKKPTIGKAIYCEVQRPDRQNISLKTPDCSYETKAVSESHAGTWILRYGLANSMELIQRELTVEVLDPQDVEVHVDYNKESISMSCMLPFQELKYCMFKKPDQTVLIVPQAVGNDRYEFSGSSYDLSNDQKIKCGLTILKPMNDDYGTWKCMMHHSFGESSAFVRVERKDTKMKQRVLRSRAEHTYVKRGDNFELKCSIEAKLDYCWMQSPNGSIYSVTKDGSQPNSLEYTGEGLELGVCGAIVENADDTHAGDWSCQLGVHGSTEVESIVPVTVTESYLYSSASAEIKSDGKWSESLHCYTFPKAEATIDYCRWVSPNHRGIFGQDSEHYKLTKYSHECILESKNWKFEDFGKWTCYARLSDGTDDEVYSTVELREILNNNGYGYRNFFNHLAIVFLFVCLVGAIVGFYKQKFQRNNVLPPTPPPYPQSCGMSKEEIIEKGEFR